MCNPLVAPFSLLRGCLEYGINHMEVSRANMLAAGEKSIFSPAAGILPYCNLLSRAGFSAFSRNPCCRHHRRCPGCSCKSLVLRLCLRFERGIIGDSFPALTEIDAGTAFWLLQAAGARRLHVCRELWRSRVS